MCGIAGYYAPDGLGEAEGRALLERLGGALVHRGPDDRGSYLHPRAGLAVTRLAIIDPAGGHMPVWNETRTVVAVLNGELYDHARHRRALLERGHHLASGSDAEILPHLYEEQGGLEPALLTGMFAVALFDVTRGALWLARDRLGIKPLFYAWSEDQRVLLFASEVKALLATGSVSRRVDRRALLDLGTAGYPLPPRTMFEAVRALPPGHRWRVARDGAPERYWRMPYPREAPGPLDAAQERPAVEALRETFDQVVRDHLLSDVPLGSYLSGGIDSVSVAARASAAQPGLTCFSMGFAGQAASFDESPHARLAAEAMGARLHPVPLTSIDEEVLTGTIRAMEAPQLHTVAFCLYQLAREVKRAGFKVVLSGEGADELFAGYSVFRFGRLRRSWLGRRRWLRRALAAVLLRRQPALRRELVRAWGVEGDAAARYGVVPPWHEQWWLLAEPWAQLLHPALGSALVQEEALWPELPPLADGPGSPLHRELAFEQASRLDGWVLALGDRLGMAHGVEVRVPFLDHRLAELTARVHPELLLRRYREKHLLREAMAGRIPDEIRLRKKRAFMAPAQPWLFPDPAPDFVRDRLSPDALRRVGWLDPARVEALWPAARIGGGDFRALRATWALTLALGVQVFAEELGAT